MAATEEKTEKKYLNDLVEKLFRAEPALSSKTPEFFLQLAAGDSARVKECWLAVVNDHPFLKNFFAGEDGEVLGAAKKWELSDYQTSLERAVVPLVHCLHLIKNQTKPKDWDADAEKFFRPSVMLIEDEEDVQFFAGRDEKFGLVTGPGPQENFTGLPPTHVFPDGIRERYSDDEDDIADKGVDLGLHVFLRLDDIAHLALPPVITKRQGALAVGLRDASFIPPSVQQQIAMTRKRKRNEGEGEGEKEREGEKTSSSAMSDDESAFWVEFAQNLSKNGLKRPKRLENALMLDAKAPRWLSDAMSEAFDYHECPQLAPGMLPINYVVGGFASSPSNGCILDEALILSWPQNGDAMVLTGALSKEDFQNGLPFSAPRKKCFLEYNLLG